MNKATSVTVRCVALFKNQDVSNKTCQVPVAGMEELNNSPFSMNADVKANNCDSVKENNRAHVATLTRYHT